MPEYYERKTETETLAIGIKGNLDSLCGAIRRFQRHGTQWNGLLSLKEQCARRIALIKNEQIKCFITAYLPSPLFQYVTKDLFNLRRHEFVSKYPKPLLLCEECIMDTGKEPKIKCHCPNLDAAIYKLNKRFFKRMNKGNKTKTNRLRKLELIYRLPNDEDGNWQYHEEPISYFLHLSPCEYNRTSCTDDTDDMESIPYQSHRFINGQASVEEKLLFVDIMRFFGAFHSEHEQPELILSERCDIDR
jgi:hypothetical protein